MDSLITAYTGSSSKVTALFREGDYTVTSAKVFPSNMALKFLPGARLNISTGIAATSQGYIEAGNYQIKTGVGTFSIVTANNPIILDDWFTTSTTGIIRHLTTVNYIPSISIGAINLPDNALSGDKIEGGTVASISIQNLNVISINAIDANLLQLAYFGNATTDYVVTAGTSVTLSGEASFRDLTIQAGATLNITPLGTGGMGYYSIRVNRTFTFAGHLSGVGGGQAGSAGGASVGALTNGNAGSAITVYTIGTIGGTGGYGGTRGGAGATSGSGGAISYYYDQTFARSLAGGAGTTGGDVAGNVGNAGISVPFRFQDRVNQDSYPVYGSGGSGGGSGTGTTGGTGAGGGLGGAGGANLTIAPTALLCLEVRLLTVPVLLVRRAERPVLL